MLYNIPRLSECLKRELRRRIKLILMMHHGLVLLLGLLVKDSIIISKHDFEHDSPQTLEKTQMRPKMKIMK